MEISALIKQFAVLQENILLNRLVIIFIYAVLAKAVDIFIDRVLRRLAAKTKISFDDKLIKYLHAPICWTVFGFGFLHALAVGTLSDPWQVILPQIAQSLILILWLIAVIRMFNWLIEQYMSGARAKGRIGQDLFMLLKNVLRVVVIIAGLLWLLSIWQISLTPLFASAGIAGIAVALAAKDTLANFFG